MATAPDALLAEMTSRLVAALQPDKVILFGSQEWGSPDESSDIDIYVIVPDSSDRPVQRARKARACIGDIRMPLDILVRTRAEAEKYRHLHASLESQVFEKGRVLYERH